MANRKYPYTFHRIVLLCADVFRTHGRQHFLSRKRGHIEPAYPQTLTFSRILLNGQALDRISEAELRATDRRQLRT